MSHRHFSGTGISQGFDKCTKKLHCRTNIFEKRLAMAASVLKCDHDIIIIKSAESLKLFWYNEVAGRWIVTKIC